MGRIVKKISLFIMLGIGLGGCLSPAYIDSKNDIGTVNPNSVFGEVNYHVSQSYKENPPLCVAILPLSSSTAEGAINPDNGFDPASMVRKAMYAHLATQGKKDVEISRIDFILSTAGEEENSDYTMLGNRLGCDALIMGEVTEFGSNFMGVYSKVSIGAKLKMIRAENGELLWEGEHVAASHGGSVPLSPMGLVSGIIDAAMNVDEEQTFRVADDLARRLTMTIPDNRIAVLESSNREIVYEKLNDVNSPQSLDSFLAGIKGKTTKQQKNALIKAINENLFHGSDMRRAHTALLEIDPNDTTSNGLYAKYLVDNGEYFNGLQYASNSIGADSSNHAMHFLKGRILIKLNNFAKAEESILNAIAFDKNNADYFNGLGFLNSLRGNHERALAAYQMALDIDPTNGYSLYNMGVTFYNANNLYAAREYIYQASQIYLQKSKYGQVVKALADLKEISSMGVDATKEISDLEIALKAAQKNG